MGPPRYWRPWVGKTLVIINWVTLLFFVLVFPNCAYREHNSFVLLAHHVATLTNQTDCWVCAPTPLSPKTGMPLDMLPLTLAELATTKEQERMDSPFWNKTSLQQATYQDQEYSVAVLTEGVLCFTRNQSDPYGHPVGKSSCVITQWADGYWIKCIGHYTVRLQMEFEKVALELEDSVSNLGSAVKTLNKEVQQLRTFSLQNRLALDYLLASQGGVCALIGPRCCVYVNDSSYEIYEKGGTG
ncbi:unnamed protein product [Lepidochelys kempii]